MALSNLKTLSILWVVVVGAVALLWAVSGLGQPLWVDELHSSWTISGSWTELWSRARQGNQTATYFVLLYCFTWIFSDSPDWWIRLPSVLAWSAAVASLAWMLLRRSIAANGPILNGPALNGPNKQSKQSTHSLIGQAAVVLWSMCVLVDAWQYFYAVEARVYAIVQLTNLWAWFIVIQLASSCRQTSRWSWLVWTALAVVLLHLHITSGLSVIFQSAVLVLNALWTGRDRAYCLTSQILIGLNAAWLFYDSQAVWQRRQQWVSFAGDGSLVTLSELFPFVPLLVPVAAVWLLGRGIQGLRHSGRLGERLGLRRGLKSGESQIDVGSSRLDVCLWGIAALAPCLLAWLLTRYNIAPMFHYRFVIVSALPLYLFVGHWWLLLRSSVMRYVAVLVAFCWMNVTNGPLAPPQQGRWQNERQEDWRSAIEFVEQNFQASSQSLWCYAGLIEGLGLDLPITTAMDEYLSYPLRGRNRFSENETSVGPHGLVADRKLWLAQIGRSNNSPDGEFSNSSTDAWIVYRGSAERLASDLQSAGMQNFSRLVPISQFGRISVVCIKVE